MSDDIGRNSNKWLNASRSRKNNSKTRGTKRSGYIISEEENKRRKEEKRQIHGNGKYRDIGMIARIYNYYVVEPEILTKEDDIISFYDGYINYANIQLLVMSLEHKVSEKVIGCLEKYKLDLGEKTIEEILYEVGSRDAIDEKIDYSNLPTELKNNENYISGYERKTKGKEA